MSKKKSDGTVGLVIIFILVLAFLVGGVVFGISTYVKVSRQSKADEETLKAWTEVVSSSRTVPNTSRMIFFCQGSSLKGLPWNSPLGCFKPSMNCVTLRALGSLNILPAPSEHFLQRIVVGHLIAGVGVQPRPAGGRQAELRAEGLHDFRFCMAMLTWGTCCT